MDSVRWHIYYDDRTVFSSDDGPPEASPHYGALAVIQDRENTVLASQDFFVFREDYGCWIEVHAEGLLDHLVQAAHLIRAVRPGRTVPLSLYTDITRELPVDVRRLYGTR